jgi:hypothetical protein
MLINGKGGRKMNFQIRWAAIISCVLLLGVVGTGCSLNPSKESQPKNAVETAASSNLEKAFQDEMNGLDVVEHDISKGDYENAQTIVGLLHERLHASIIPSLEEKKGNSYANELHVKYHDLQDAIKEKKDTSISTLIKDNKANLVKVADLLGVSSKQ